MLDGMTMLLDAEAWSVFMPLISFETFAYDYTYF